MKNQIIEKDIKIKNLERDNKKGNNMLFSNQKIIEEYENEIRNIKNEILILKKENKNLNVELEKYENESKVMDEEIKFSKQKIKELNKQIDKLITERNSLPSFYNLQKENEIPQDKNNLFCDLYKSFSQSMMVNKKKNMIIGSYLKQQENHTCKRLNNEKHGKNKKIIKNLDYEPKKIDKHNKTDINIIKEEKENKIDNQNQKEIYQYENRKSYRRYVSNRILAKSEDKLIPEIGKKTKIFENVPITPITTKKGQVYYMTKRIEISENLLGKI